MWTKINRDYFNKDSRPKKEQWCHWVESGQVAGKILGDTPYIDERHFVAHTKPQPVKPPPKHINLLE